MDRITATWFYGLQSLLVSAGLLSRRKIKKSFLDPLKRWKSQHAHDRPLHSGKMMREATSRNFYVVKSNKVSYLYQYFCDDLEVSKRGYDTAKSIFDLENRLVNEKMLRPVGLQLTARKN